LRERTTNRRRGGATAPRPERLERLERLEEPASVTPRLPRGSETVLLIEDDPALRELVLTLLEGGGYTVLWDETPAAALALVGRHAGPIHLLLTDVTMPGMSGPDVAARFGALRPEAHVLYMSGYPAAVVGQRQPLPAGAPLLEKPFTEESLLRKVREILDGPAS
jgi:two-component system, cell cycle sensor histidine kinase and response regulator CckA